MITMNTGCQSPDNRAIAPYILELKPQHTGLESWVGGLKYLFLVQRTSVPSTHMVTHNHRTDPVTTLDQVWTAARAWGMPVCKDRCWASLNIRVLQSAFICRLEEPLSGCVRTGQSPGM